MRIGLREKLFLVSAAVLVLSATAGYGYATRVLEGDTHRRLHQDALARAGLLAREIEIGGGPIEPSRRWDDLADELAAAARGRVTLFASDGRVAGDSALDLETIVALGGGTPSDETIAALDGRSETAARFSPSSLEPLVFGAAPIRADGAVIGAARVGLPLAPVGEVRSLVASLTILYAAVGLVIAAVLSNLATRLASSGVRELGILARRMAGGDLEARARAAPDEVDLADLGRSLEQLADGLRRSLRELVGERDLLSGILTGMSEGVLLVDRDGKVALLNPALREMLLLRDDDVGKLPIEVIRDAALHDLLDNARRSGRAAQREIEVTGLKPRKLLVRAELLEVEPGGLLVVFYDVTDLRRLETLRRDFVANASHELRTPVTSIRSAVETILSMPPDDADGRARFFGIVERNAERLQRLIDDLLDLSKIESRELDLASEAIDVRPIAERTIALFAERASRTKTTLTLGVPAGLPQALGDARALERILLNLVDNAIKYCPGATVTIGAEADDAQVTVHVVDTGPGIEARHRDRLFERFYRVDAGRSRQLGGTGLGLAIVKHLSEAMGGSIIVSSTVGKGTRFSLHLPLVQPTPVSQRSGRSPVIADG
jgi:two-component system phosphate regulon sensor histidine kinase PhoR